MHDSIFRFLLVIHFLIIFSIRFFFFLKSHWFKFHFVLLFWILLFSVVKNTLVKLLCLLYLFLMVYNWFKVFHSFFQMVLMSFLPVQNILCWNIFKLWNPSFNVLTIRIILFSLKPRIEDSYFSWVSSDSSNILPISSILRWRIIGKFLCEIFLSFFPVNE